MTVQASNDESMETVPRLMSIPEVADVLNVCTMTVRRAIWAGRLRSVRLGSAIRVRVDVLRAYVDSLG